MRILWVTRDKTNRILNHYFKGFRLAVSKFADVTSIFVENDNNPPELLQNYTYINNNYDLVYTDIYLLNFIGWKKINIPKIFFLNDLHGKYIKNAIATYIAYGFNAGATTYYSPLKSLHPYIFKKLKIIWNPFCIDTAIFKDYKLKKEFIILQTGAITTPYYPLRNKVYIELSGYSGYTYIPHPGYTASIHNWPMEIQYAQLLNKSIYSISCTSILNYVVLKTFEIPACNSILCSSYIPELTDLGFINDVNMIELTLDKPIKEQLACTLNDKNKLNELSNNGYNLVHNNHTADIRGQEFICKLQEILNE